MDVVDGHLHLFKALSDDYPRAVFRHHGRRPNAPRPRPPLEAMDAAGGPGHLLRPLPHDRYLARMLAEHPGRFAGVAVYDFEDSDPLASCKAGSTPGSRAFRFYGLEGEPVPIPSRWPCSRLWPPCATRA